MRDLLIPMIGVAVSLLVIGIGIATSGGVLTAGVLALSVPIGLLVVLFLSNRYGRGIMSDHR